MFENVRAKRIKIIYVVIGQNTDASREYVIGGSIRCSQLVKLEKVRDRRQV